MSWSYICQHGKSLSKINLFVEKYILYDTIYMKFKIRQIKVCMNISYGDIWNIDGKKITKFRTVVTRGKGKEGWVREGYTIFPRMFYLWKYIFEESIAQYYAWVKLRGENVEGHYTIFHAGCFVFGFGFFWLNLWHVEVPRPRTEHTPYL